MLIYSHPLAIIHHIPQDSEDVEPLQIAAGILTEICSMKVDDETRRAAIFWSLKETIDGFPVCPQAIPALETKTHRLRYVGHDDGLRPTIYRLHRR